MNPIKNRHGFRYVDSNLVSGDPIFTDDSGFTYVLREEFDWSRESRNTIAFPQLSIRNARRSSDTLSIFWSRALRYVGSRSVWAPYSSFVSISEPRRDSRWRSYSCFVAVSRQRATFIHTVGLSAFLSGSYTRLFSRMKNFLCQRIGTKKSRYFSYRVVYYVLHRRKRRIWDIQSENYSNTCRRILFMKFHPFRILPTESR